MDILGDLKEEHCEADKIFFNKNEIVNFIATDFKYDERTKHIYIKTIIDSGVNQGKDYTIFINGGDHEVAKKIKAQFFYKSGFWTKEELANRDIKLARVIGHRLQGQATKVTEKAGDRYQSIVNIKDLGPAEPKDSARSTVPSLADIHF
jgi:hypothetical protein